MAKLIAEATGVSLTLIVGLYVISVMMTALPAF